MIKMISKEEFCGYVDDIYNFTQFENALFMLFSDNHGWLETPISFYKVVEDIIDLISKGFPVSKEAQDWIAEDIYYFCYELDFGENYESGKVKDENDNDIDFSSAEKLYDYLVTVR